MRMPRFTEEQIIGILQEHATGAKVNELLRRYAVSKETFYRWRRRYGGLQVKEARRLCQLEEENRRLNRKWSKALHCLPSSEASL